MPKVEEKPLSTLPTLTQSQRQAAIDRVMTLLAIPGGSGNEGEVAEFIRGELISAGADPRQLVTDTANRRTPQRGDTGNLILRLSGSQRDARRMLLAHMDTVPICVGCKPRRSGNRVRSGLATTGLGADDRAGVATVLTTAMHILRAGLPHPPLTFLWTIQEETGLHGARLVNLAKLGKPQMAFNWDGGAPHKLTIGATGGYRMKIDITGKAAHAGNAPATGISAIAIAALAIADLQRSGWHGDVRKSKQRGTSNLGVIEGGSATNVVADHVRLTAEARSHDAGFRMRIVQEMEKAFLRAADQVKSDSDERGTIAFEGRLDYESFCLRTDAPCVALVTRAVESLGLRAELAIANGGLDANWLTARGIPTVSLGCGQRNQHMLTEELRLDEYLTACQLGIRLATLNY